MSSQPSEQSTEKQLADLLAALEGRKGATAPRIGTARNPALPTKGPVLEALAELAGFTLMPWQVHHNEIAYEVLPSGAWAHPTVTTLAGRQNGKTMLLLPRILAALFIFDEKLILHTAQNRKVPVQLFEQLVEVIHSTPAFKKHIPRRGGIIGSNGKESITTKMGTSYHILAPTASSFRSYSANLLIFDEAREQHERDLWAAAIPTQRAVMNPQRLVISNAGDVDSVVLNELQDRGRAPEPGDDMAYFEWSGADGCELDDPDALQAANPALGYMLRPQAIIEELVSMAPQKFRTEALCQRVASDRNVPVVAPEDWLKNAISDEWVEKLAAVPDEDTVWLAFDIDAEHARAAIVMVWWKGEELICDLIAMFNNPVEQEVADKVNEIAAQYFPLDITFDPFTSSGIAERVAAEGWNTVPVRSVNYFTACGRFFDAVSSGILRHPDKEELNEDVYSAARNSTGDGGWALSRKKSTDHISATEALVRAVYSASKPRAVPTIG